MKQTDVYTVDSIDYLHVYIILSINYLHVDIIVTRVITMIGPYGPNMAVIHIQVISPRSSTQLIRFITTRPGVPVPGKIPW